MAVELYDEHEQGERVRSWIREYGYSIVIGLGLAFAGIFGFNQWQQHQVGQKLLAAEYFDRIQVELDLGSVSTAAERLEAMREETRHSAFIGLASLLVAAAHVEDGSLEPAARLYREVLADRRLSALWPTTTLRLARVLEAQGDITGAMRLLDGTVPSGFEGAWAELRGDLHLARGERELAAAAFQQALEYQSGQGVSEFMLQMKLDATGVVLDNGASS